MAPSIRAHGPRARSLIAGSPERGAATGRAPSHWGDARVPNPLQDAQRPLALPWTESAICAAAQTSRGPVEIFCVHVPNAANGPTKPQTLQGLRDGVAVAGSGPRVVCGDLNTPRRELRTGEVISFARDRHGRLRRDRGPEWDAAELSVVPGLRDLGYRDAYRAVHGYESSEPSWTWKRIAGHNGGWRIDHIFVSTDLQPTACLYHHAWRDAGLSDHSALEADFVWRAAHMA